GGAGPIWCPSCGRFRPTVCCSKRTGPTCCRAICNPNLLPAEMNLCISHTSPRRLHAPGASPWRLWHFRAPRPRASCSGSRTACHRLAEGGVARFLVSTVEIQRKHLIAHIIGDHLYGPRTPPRCDRQDLE